MLKYWQIVKNTWQESITYRLNFILWRVRRVLNLLLVYFLWLTIFTNQSEVFGYNRVQILTYILLSNIVGSFVFATRTLDIGGQINRGDLSNFLLKPIFYTRYWAARDISDKLLNIVFSIAEVLILIILFKPSIFLQKDIAILLLFAASIALGIILYFYISFLLGLIGFWSPEVWAPRFIFFILTQFFVGSIFPLDILPRSIFNILKILPFPYLMFFPLKIYLGQLSLEEIVIGMIFSFSWFIILFFVAKVVWQKGLKSYTAEGR